MHKYLFCEADIAAQDETYPTYKMIDCDLHINENDNFYGVNMDCDLYILTSLVTACKNWEQGIRTTVTIDGVDVTSALVGAINISRIKNQIATFSLQLGSEEYSPLTNSHIFPNKEVVIISYLNKHDATLFTGLIDDVNADWSGSFTVNITGSGYGKKLRDTRKSLISIQNSASSKYRGDLIKYLVQQAGISSSKINTVRGSYTKIDHSFDDQSILDMINKELIIDSMQWEFDENGIFNTFYDIPKTSTETYPTPDWTYGEDRFFYLSLATSDEGIINDITISGTVYETRIEVENPKDSPYAEYITPPPKGYTDTQLAYFSNSFSQGQEIDWNASNNNFELTTQTGGVTMWYLVPPGASVTYYKFYIDWRGDDYEVTGIDYTSGGHITVTQAIYKPGGPIYVKIKRTAVMVGEYYQEGEGSIQIAIRGKYKGVQDATDSKGPTSAVVDGKEVSQPTYEYHYDQVSARVTDSYSINKYGRRVAKEEFPLAENTNQCKGIGRKLIKDSHRYTKQPIFEVPFNPLLKVGQTIAITDSKIGYNQRWYVEEVSHTIEQGKGRTRVRCVYYV